MWSELEAALGMPHLFTRLELFVEVDTDKGSDPELLLNNLFIVFHWWREPSKLKSARCVFQLTQHCFSPTAGARCSARAGLGAGVCVCVCVCVCLRLAWSEEVCSRGGLQGFKEDCKDP